MEENNTQADYDEVRREEYEYDLFCSQNLYARTVNNDFWQCLAENMGFRAEIASRDEEIKALDELVEALEDACQIEPSALSRARARLAQVREGRKT